MDMPPSYSHCNFCYGYSQIVFAYVTFTEIQENGLSNYPIKLCLWLENARFSEIIFLRFEHQLITVMAANYYYFLLC